MQNQIASTNIYLEKLIIAKAIICPVIPNISIVPRPLFPWTSGFLPSESIAQPVAFNKATTYDKAHIYGVT